MTAWAYTLVYNEALMIRYWARHYRTFCERLIVYVDTDTDDDTEGVACAAGAEVRPYQGSGHLDDMAFIAFAQQQYREARGHADWVVWTDADEIVYHSRLSERLDEFRADGVNMPRTVGYSMLSHTPPSGYRQIYDEIRRGIPAPEYGKVAIFDPALDVTWSAGKHDATASGAVRDDGADPLKLLHYRWLGDEWFRQRNARNYSRVDEQNRRARHGKETYPNYVGTYSPDWYLGKIDGAQMCV